MNPTLRPIGVVHSPFVQSAGTPIQTSVAAGAEGCVELLPEFAPGLRDLDGFDRIWLLCWLHRAAPAPLLVKPFLDQQERGVFSTRSPARPNSIGLSCVRLLRVDGPRLRVADLDLLDGTPLLDIKPYVPAFDSLPAARVGWFEGKNLAATLADARFERR